MGFYQNTGAEQHAQLNKYCGGPGFLERVEAFREILNQVILLDVISGGGGVGGCEKSKPIIGMRRNELVDVRGWRCGWRAAEADIPQASTLIGPRLEELMGSFRC